MAPGTIVDITTPAVDYKRHLEKAQQLIRDNRLPEAAVELKKSLEMKPDYPDTLNEYGYVLANMGQLQEAVVYCKKAIEIEPRYWPAFYSLGMIAARQGKVEEAIGYYRRTLEIDPGVSAAQFNWGNLLRDQGRFDEALLHYRKAAEAKPTDETLTNIAIILIQRGRVSEAVLNLRAALKANPEYVEALNALAYLLATGADVSLRDGKEAVQLAESACKLTMYGNPSLLDTLACAYAEAGRFDDAIRTAEKAVDLGLKSGNKRVASEFRSHLDLFKKQKPFHAGK
jgi:tetratricopeptide (TPR) repeat protein